MRPLLRRVAGAAPPRPAAAALLLLLLLSVGGAAEQTDGTGGMEGMDGTGSSPERDPTFFGCGRTDLNASYHYGLINRKMHEGMSIRFTGNAEYDFSAGMIPHHSAAVDMCRVYEDAVAAAAAAAAEGGGEAVVEPNEGIESLCYNITFGPKSRGDDQADFSQPGENAQMLSVIDTLGMTAHYEAGCSALTEAERQDIAADSDHGMFMGCGRLDLQSTKDYIEVNMAMHMRMALDFTGDPHVDFLLGMIPHHEGAIEMCHIYYRYWSCAPRKQACNDPGPLVGLPEGTLTDDEEAAVRTDVIKAMDHICNEHILETQPPEVAWMRRELRRLDIQALAAYNAMTGDGAYPCDDAGHGGGHGGMHGGTDMNETNGGHDGMDTNETNGEHGGMDMGDSDGGHTATSNGGSDAGADTGAQRNTTTGDMTNGGANGGGDDGNDGDDGDGEAKDGEEAEAKAKSGGASWCVSPPGLALPHLLRRSSLCRCLLGPLMTTTTTTTAMILLLRNV